MQQGCAARADAQEPRGAHNLPRANFNFDTRAMLPRRNSMASEARLLRALVEVEQCTEDRARRTAYNYLQILLLQTPDLRQAHADRIQGTLARA